MSEYESDSMLFNFCDQMRLRAFCVTSANLRVGTQQSNAFFLTQLYVIVNLSVIFTEILQVVHYEMKTNLNKPRFLEKRTTFANQ